MRRTRLAVGVAAATMLLVLSTGAVAMAQIKLADIKEDAWYSIIACHSGKALEIQGAGKDNGLQLQQNEPTGADNQLFQFKQIQSGYFRITVKNAPRAPLCQYDLGKEFASSTAIQVGSFAKNAAGNWEFTAMGVGNRVDIAKVLEQYS